MTSLGHILVGASIGLLCMPPTLEKTRQRLAFVAGMIFVANLPDWPVPGWGHFRLDISHSIIVNGAVMLLIALGMRQWFGPAFRKYRIAVVGVAIAWMSHFLLDALYADGRVAIFWPISDASVSLPVPWLKTMPHVPPPFDRRVLTIFMFEALTFAPLLALAVAIRMRRFSPRAKMNRQV